MLASDIDAVVLLHFTHHESALDGADVTHVAQLVNALLKLREDKKVKSGPAFIYTYIPLSYEQEDCPNIEKLDKDPFLKRSD